VSPPAFWAPGTVLVVGAQVVLEGDEGHHAATVRRLRVGEHAVLTDGDGTAADSVVTAVGRDRLTLVVGSVRLDPAPTPRLVVVQALPKGDRGQTAVETLTEVGVDVIVPWSAARCVTHWSEQRGAKAVERWRAAAREAAKQSRRSNWPKVADLASTTEVVARLSVANLGVVLHEAARTALASAAVPTRGEVVVVVGPEGGLDEAELAAFSQAGASAYRLGESVLRSSTAGTVAAAVLLARTARWGR
jgi:16S rRNA (uracil1498-N3)-methyltransferase